MSECMWCGEPLTWWDAGTLRDGTHTNQSHWYHYDLVFETERGIQCADQQHDAAPVNQGPSWWARVRHPFRSRQAQRWVVTARHHYKETPA